MNKRERFNAAVNGGAIDHPPVTAWVHFQSDHLPGTKVAELHEAFIEAYDWDILKIMNDYRYPVPKGVETLELAGSLSAYQRLDLSEPSFANQLECLQRLRNTLGADTPMLETCFEPYQQILRNIGFDQAPNFLKHMNESLVDEALEAVTQTTCDYIRQARALGVDGIFLSINGAIPHDQPRGVTDEQHERFQKPYTTRVLEAAEGMVRVLHVHGNHLNINRARDYPCEVISVSDRLSNNPSLKELRTWTDKCLMGGIDETRIQDRSLPALRAEVDDAIAQAGREKLILAPGCTIPSFTPLRNLAHLRQYTRGV